MSHVHVEQVVVVPEQLGRQRGNAVRAQSEVGDTRRIPDEIFGQGRHIAMVHDHFLEMRKAGQQTRRNHFQLNSVEVQLENLQHGVA